MRWYSATLVFVLSFTLWGKVAQGQDLFERGPGWKRKVEEQIQKLRQRIEQLETEGKKEQAQKLRERLKRLERLRQNPLLQKRKGLGPWAPRSFPHGGRWRQLLVRPPHPNLRDVAHYGIAQIYLQKGKAQKAIEELRKVATQSPDRASRSAAQLSIGHIFVWKKQWRQALLEYAKVEPPFRKRALLMAMRLLRRLRKQQEKDPAALFQKFLQFCRSPREKALAHLVIAQFYMKQRNMDKALQHLQQVTSLPYLKLREKGKKKSSPKKQQWANQSPHKKKAPKKKDAATSSVR